MRDFDSSTLWEVSGFEEVRRATGTSGFARLGERTVLPTTLLADLTRYDPDPASNDVLEVAAASMRKREALLVYLRCDGLVWPLTLFPLATLYHCPRSIDKASPAGLANAAVLGIEPPGVRPPGHWLSERVAHAEHYRPLLPLLWSLALGGPRRALLGAIAEAAAYRAVGSPAEDGLALPGALGPAVDRLREKTVPLRTIAAWPGMSVERASRLLNGLYLTNSLLATQLRPTTLPGQAATRASPGNRRGH